MDFKETKMMLPNIRNKAWKVIKGKSRRGVMYATQILTGHACVQKHLFKMNSQIILVAENVIIKERALNTF